MNEIIYIQKPTVNPLSFRERRAPALPLFKMSQTIGLVGLIVLLVFIHGITFDDLGKILFQFLILAYPVFWLFDTNNGSIRLEAYIRIALFFMRLIIQMPRRSHPQSEEAKLAGTGEGGQIIWYDDERTVYL